MFCLAGTKLWLKIWKDWRSRSHVKVIHKSHQFVESDLRLVLLNKDKKFEDDAIARFCCSVRWLNRFAQVETKKNQKKNHGNRFNNNIDREYLSVNNKIAFKTTFTQDTKRHLKQFKWMWLHFIAVVAVSVYDVEITRLYQCVAVHLYLKCEAKVNSNDLSYVRLVLVLKQHRQTSNNDVINFAQYTKNHPLSLMILNTSIRFTWQAIVRCTKGRPQSLLFLMWWCQEL